MMSRRGRWFAFHGLLLAGALAITGCADLQSVRDFAKTSAATADYRQIVTDYSASPERQKRLQPERYAAALDALAAERAEQARKLQAAQAVLVAYMSALGDLAADDLPNVDSQVDGLNKALEKAGFIGTGDAAIGKETASAASTIAKILVRAAMDHWRQARLEKIIAESHDSIQAVTAGLREMILQDFTRSLDVEAEATRKYFEATIAAATAADEAESVPPLAKVLWLDRQDAIAARRARLVPYAELLDKIGKGHADLAAHKGTLNDKALAARLKQYSQDLRKLYKAAAILAD